MPQAYYFVCRNGMKWRLRHHNKDYTYDSQVAAIKAAVDAAYGSGNKGYDAQVLIRGRDGKWKTKWTYGHDRYPPGG